MYVKGADTLGVKAVQPWEQYRHHIDKDNNSESVTLIKNNSLVEALAWWQLQCGICPWQRQHQRQEAFRNSMAAALYLNTLETKIQGGCEGF